MKPRKCTKCGETRGEGLKCRVCYEHRYYLAHREKAKAWQREYHAKKRLTAERKRVSFKPNPTPSSYEAKQLQGWTPGQIIKRFGKIRQVGG